MKKLLLVSTALLTGALMVNAQTAKVATNLPNKAVHKANILSTDDSYAKAAAAFSGPSTLSSHPHPMALQYRVVGYTHYDLQTNSSIARRIINNADGSVSMAWTMATDATPWSTRGSGWNFWKATGGLVYSAGPTARVEGSVRTGFANIGVLGNGSSVPYQEVMMAHKGAPYDFQLSTNTTLGNSTWNTVVAGATLTASVVPGYTAGTSDQALWAKIATGGSDGNSIHIVANYFPTDNIMINGMLAPTVYSRSQDGGGSWDRQSIILPGIDSTMTVGGSADDYSIDAEGTTVGIVMGTLGESVNLWKSTDNGTTFTKTAIETFPHAAYDTTHQDTVQTSDGSMSIAVSNGVAHVAYAGVRVVGNIQKATNAGFFPGDMSIIYWNDVTKTPVDILANVTAADLDAAANGGNANGTYDVGSTTTVFSASNAGGRYGNKALANEPSIAVDGTDIYILFSLPRDADTASNGASFRDIWISASTDGGATWGKPQNVTCDNGNEDYFASLAKHVDAKYLHVLWQNAVAPGTIVQSGVPDNNDEIHWGVLDKAKVKAGTAGCQMGAMGVNEISTNAFTFENYPNPTHDITYFNVDMKENANLVLNVYNNVGQMVYTSENRFNTGRHLVSVDASSFASGLYLYTIKSGDSVIGGKFTKE